MLRTAGKTHSVLLGLMLLCTGTAQAVEEANGTPFDLQGFIDKELLQGSKHVVVPPGRYRVTPKNHQHLALRGLHDVEIVADGVEMICTETTRAISIAECRNVTIRGLTIDYDPLPFTQGRITAISADRLVHEVELFAGYPTAEYAKSFKHEIFRPDTRTLRCEDPPPMRIETVDSRHVRLVFTQGSASDDIRVGDSTVLSAEYAPHGSAGHAIECDSNENVRLESITLYASNCFGFIEHNCSASTYYRCKIDRRPVANDPVQRADARLRSLNADAYHSKQATKGPAYIECSARFMGDDCINICGDYHMVVHSRGNQLRVLAKWGMNIRPDDPVELVAYDGHRLPDAKAVAVESDGTIRDDERAFIARQHLDENLRTARGDALHRAYAITLDRKVEMERGSLICAANRVGNGFRVEGCDFGNNRSRGILIKASQGRILRNRIEGCWMSAILVSPEYWWLEAGSSNDLRIEGNTITSCRGVPINVQATAGNGEIAACGAHRNITIAANRIDNCARPGIRVTSTSGLHLEKNAMNFLPADQALPGIPRRPWARGGGRVDNDVELIHCDQ